MSRSEAGKAKSHMLSPSVPHVPLPPSRCESVGWVSERVREMPESKAVKSKCEHPLVPRRTCRKEPDVATLLCPHFLVLSGTFF